MEFLPGAPLRVSLTQDNCGLRIWHPPGWESDSPGEGAPAEVAPNNAGLPVQLPEAGGRWTAAPRKASVPPRLELAGGVFARKIGELKVPRPYLSFSTLHRSELRKIPNYAIHKNTLEKCCTQVHSTKVWHHD